MDEPKLGIYGYGKVDNVILDSQTQEHYAVVYLDCFAGNVIEKMSYVSPKLIHLNIPISKEEHDTLKKILDSGKRPNFELAGKLELILKAKDLVPA